MKKLYLLSILIFISGCSMSVNREKLSSDVLQKNKGVLVLSTGAAETCLIEQTLLQVLSTTEKHFFDYKVLNEFMVNYPTRKSDFKDVHGNVYAVALEAGEYTLRVKAAHPYLDYKEELKPNVKITSGKMTYIGEFYIERGCKTIAYVIRDNFERDKVMLATIYPELDVDRIEKNIFMYEQ